jgi:hypothetical protein
MCCKHISGQKAQILLIGDLPLNEPEESDAPKVRMVTEARHTFGVPAAAQLWLELGLPVVPAMLHAPGQRDLMEFRQLAAT